MIPIGPLMREHRLIERMVALLDSEVKNIKAKGAVDPVFIETAADFYRTYADRCHHGKEEEILFRDLAKKDLSGDHLNIMNELVEDHKLGRKMVRGLIEAKERYVQGDASALKDIIELMEKLIEFYPNHIVKEDKEFFYPCMEYFDKEEKDRMLDEFWDFDKKMIHEKYERVVEKWESGQ
jgi:hemerythrin-like domain-containing protein